MDNVSHTLVSLALGSALCELPPLRRKSKEVPRFFSAILLTSFLANNLPDLDVIASEILQPRPMGTLLNHRGFTHTFAFAPVGGFLAVIGAWLFFHRFWKKDWNLPAFAVGVSGILMHLFMDYWNDYGIHPFWPISNHWYYGDILNVIDPLFWFALFPFAWELLRKTKLRVFVAVLGAAMIGLCWAAPYTRGVLAVAITLWALFSFWFQARLKGLKPAVVLASFVVAVSFVSSQVVHARVQRLFPREKLLQVIGAPAAADPFCWRVIVVSLRDGEKDYSMRLGTLSLFPQLIAPQSCWYGVFGEHLAPLEPVTNSPTDSGLVWKGEFVRPVSDFLELRDRSCQFEQFLKFSRAPYWGKTEQGDVAGDLRYDRGNKIGFAEFRLKGPKGCLRIVPPWKQPIDLNR